MKKLLSWIAVTAMLLGLATVAGATGSSDPATWDASIFEIPEDLYVFHDDPADQIRYDYLGVECWDPIGFGIYHYTRGVVDYYQWLDKMEKIPAATEENGSICSSTTVVFWNGVPNLSKNLFKWAEGKTKDVYIPDSVTEIAEDCFVEGSHITLHFTANNEVALAYALSRGMNYVIVPEPDASEPSDKVVLDTSVFFVEPDIATDCMCSDFIGVYHLAKDGITFFKWAGNMERMPEGLGFCSPNSPWRETVVFLDGVPNLIGNLFKNWENGTDDVYIPDSVTEIDENCFVEGSHITLHFTANNETALAYAQSRGMAFEVMDGERMPGDVNFDKSVDMQDVLALRKTIAHLPAAVEIYSTDVNGDDSTDMKDVLALRRKIAHLDPISHSEFDAAEPGTPVTVETYVQDKQIIRADGKASLYTQSEDGAYFIYAMPCTQEEYDALTPGTGIRVSGTKSVWSGEVEITDATFEVIDGSYLAPPLDVTALLGTDELIGHQNERVVFRGVTVEAKTDKEGHDAAFLYGWDGSGEEGDDLYFDAAVDGKKITFTVESDLCGADTDVYKAVKALQVGDTVDLGGYLYWYDGPNPHVTAVTPAA